MFVVILLGSFKHHTKYVISIKTTRLSSTWRLIFRTKCWAFPWRANIPLVFIWIFNLFVLSKQKSTQTLSTWAYLWKSSIFNFFSANLHYSENLVYNFLTYWNHSSTTRHIDYSNFMTTGVIYYTGVYGKWFSISKFSLRRSTPRSSSSAVPTLANLLRMTHGYIGITRAQRVLRKHQRRRYIRKVFQTTRNTPRENNMSFKIV